MFSCFPYTRELLYGAGLTPDLDVIPPWLTLKARGISSVPLIKPMFSISPVYNPVVYRRYHEDKILQGDIATLSDHNQ